jgi:hypothetical protein
MQQIVEKLTGGEALTVDQMIEYLTALKEVPRAQLDIGRKVQQFWNQEV